MALHPFRTFRKHQKVIWGFLVIVCMFTFVLTYGRGDIFDRLSSWSRTWRSTTPVATLYGRTVDTRQLDEARRKRLLAAQALEAAMALASEKVDVDLQAAQRAISRQPSGGNADFTSWAKALQEKSELQQAWNRLRASIQVEPVQQLLNFLVWQHQADRLGIQLTDQDVEAELRRYTKDRVAMPDVLDALARVTRQQYTTPQVAAALRDEFRVLIAQEALLSYEPEVPNQFGQLMSTGDRKVPAPVTPYEFWTYFEKERTALDVALVPVPVEPAASATPNEQDMKEIRAMYSRYKDVEARPGQAQPGFKVPRRIKASWATADPQSEYYRKAAAEAGEALRVCEAQMAAGNAILSGLPVVTDPRFLAEYNQLKSAGRFDVAPRTDPNYALSLYATRLRPENAATLVGQATAAGAQDTPFGLLTLFEAGLVQANAKDMEPLVRQEAGSRAPFGCSVLLTAAGAGPQGALGGALTAAGLVSYGEKDHQYLPPQAAQELVRDASRAALARDLAAGNLAAFQKEMATQRAKGPNAQAKIKAVEAWLPRGIEQFHLETPAEPMKEALDQYDIGKAPALQPLKEALERQSGLTPAQADEQLGPALFSEQGEYVPTSWPPSPPMMNQFMPPPPAGNYLVWLTEEKPAYVPSFDEVKDQVIAAWRLQKGRLAAQDAADKLKADLAKADGDLARVRQVAAEHKAGPPIELTQVARMVPEAVAVAAGHRYTPFRFPDSIRYPGKDWVNEMLDHLQNKGDTYVLADEPRKTYYVAVLLDRHPPTMRTFYDLYRDAAVSMQRDQLLDQFIQERREKYFQDFTKELRVEAGADPTTGKFKLSDEYLKQQENRGGKGGGQEGGQEGEE